MSGRLIESLATTPALAAVFSDESVLGAMLEFETALARALGTDRIDSNGGIGRDHGGGKPAQFRYLRPRGCRVSSRNAGNSVGQNAHRSGAKDQQGRGAICSLGSHESGRR